jgi:adenylate cyclase
VSAVSTTAEEAIEQNVVPEVLPNSVAVLPFDNLSLDPEDAFFAAGIHESTLNQLAKIHELAVIARTSVMQYEVNPPPIPEIAKALNVETVMEGSVRYANGRVLITAQLIDGQTGKHLWSDEFNRDITDVFAVQAEVAEQIATALEVQLLPDERTRIGSRPTQSAEAYQHYLRAVSLSDWGANPSMMHAYIDSLEKAIAADPRFALAYAMVGDGYWFRRDRDLALQFAQKALQLDPTVGLAYSRLSNFYGVYYARQDDANEAGKRSVELSPNDPLVLTARVRDFIEEPGRIKDAISLGQRAVAIDPTYATGHHLLGYAYLRGGGAILKQHPII